MVLLTMQQLLQLRTDKYSTLTSSLAYYDGTKSPQYLNRRLLAFFNSNPHYKMNIMSTIVDAVKNKLIIEGFNVGQPTEKQDGTIIPDPRNAVVSDMWDEGLSIEADTLHEYIHATGEGFLVVSPDENGEYATHAADPRAVVVYYGSGDPRKITQAAYFWREGERYKATAWSQDESGQVLEQSFTGQKRTISTEEPATTQTLNYAPDGDAIPTPYKRIPVFHFQRVGRNITSEFYQVKDIQDSINKAFVAQGFAIENAADAVTWMIGNAGTEELAAARAGDAVGIPPAPMNMQPVEIGQIPAADFAALGKVIDDGANYATSITSTPRHYFGNAGANISGEALQAMEAPLIAKVMRYIKRHAAMFEQFVAFMLTLRGYETDSKEVTCNYADPHTTLTVTQAQARLTNTQAGIPIETQLRMEGWREDEITQLIKDRDNAQPVELSEQIIEQANEKAAQRSAADLRPLMEDALNMIADAALEKIAGSGKLEALANKTQ